MTRANARPYRPQYRLVAALVAAAFSIWRGHVGDAWGVGFGVLALLSIAAQPRRIEDMTRGRARVLYLLIAAFFALGLAFVVRRAFG